MKKVLISAIVISLAYSAGSALAADLPTRKAPAYSPPPPPPMWTGFYFGANIGAAISGSNGVHTSAGDLFDDLAGASVFAGPTGFGGAAAASAVSNASLNNVGVIGGGQIGYNYQFSSSLVAGLEADIQGSTLQSDARVSGAAAELVTGVPVVTNAHLEKSLGYLGTVRGRLGYLVTPTLLVYGTGGLAYGDVSLSNSLFTGPIDPTGRAQPASNATNFSDARLGWTAGGGFEWMFHPNWSAKLEYLYYDLGSVTTATVVSGNDQNGAPLYAAGVRSSTNFNGHVVRAGLNYHFQWFAPAAVVAKY